MTYENYFPVFLAKICGAAIVASCLISIGYEKPFKKAVNGYMFCCITLYHSYSLSDGNVRWRSRRKPPRLLQFNYAEADEFIRFGRYKRFECVTN